VGLKLPTTIRGVTLIQVAKNIFSINQYNFYPANVLVKRNIFFDVTDALAAIAFTSRNTSTK
jgi:hypothetical protein